MRVSYALLLLFEIVPVMLGYLHRTKTEQRAPVGRISRYLEACCRDIASSQSSYEHLLSEDDGIELFFCHNGCQESCKVWYSLGYTDDGVYAVNPGGEGGPFMVSSTTAPSVLLHTSDTEASVILEFELHQLYNTATDPISLHNSVY